MAEEEEEEGDSSTLRRVAWDGPIDGVRDAAGR